MAASRFASISEDSFSTLATEYFKTGTRDTEKALAIICGALAARPNLAVLLSKSFTETLRETPLGQISTVSERMQAIHSQLARGVIRNER